MRSEFREWADEIRNGPERGGIGRMVLVGLFAAAVVVGMWVALV